MKRNLEMEATREDIERTTKKEQAMIARVNEFLTCDKQALAILLAQIETRLPAIGRLLTKDCYMKEAATVAALQDSLWRITR